MCVRVPEHNSKTQNNVSDGLRLIHTHTQVCYAPGPGQWPLWATGDGGVGSELFPPHLISQKRDVKPTELFSLDGWSTIFQKADTRETSYNEEENKPYNRFKCDRRMPAPRNLVF